MEHLTVAAHGHDADLVLAALFDHGGVLEEPPLRVADVEWGRRECQLGAEQKA